MSAIDEQDRPSRVEREVLEILERSNARQTPVESFQSAVYRQRVTSRGWDVVARQHTWLSRLNSVDIVRIVGALLLAIAAAALSNFSSLLAIALAIASAVAFFSLWFPSRAAGSQGSPRWRGQDLGSSDPPRPFWKTRIPPR